MKLMYVITRGDVIGGASLHLTQLISKGIEDGHEVSVVVGGSGEFFNLLQKIKSLKVVSCASLIREISFFKDIKCIFEMRKIIDNFAPDVIHFHSPKAAAIGRMASLFLPITKIYTVHGWPFTEGIKGVKSTLFLLVEKMLAKRTDSIITVSEFDKQLAITKKIPGRIVAIQNGVKDYGLQFKPTATAKPELKLAMVARFDEQKNHRLLIESLVPLKDEVWSLALYGDGPNIQHIKQLCSEKGLSNKINFFGRVSNVPAHLVECDVAVLISNWEGLPLTLLEAASLSKPIVASNVGGVAEVVTDKANGFLVENDTTEIKNAIEYYLRNSAAISEHGRVSREKFVESFCEKTMLDKTFALYPKDQL